MIVTISAIICNLFNLISSIFIWFYVLSIVCCIVGGTWEFRCSMPNCALSIVHMTIKPLEMEQWMLDGTSPVNKYRLIKVGHYVAQIHLEMKIRYCIAPGVYTFLVKGPKYIFGLMFFFFPGVAKCIMQINHHFRFHPPNCYSQSLMITKTQA